MFSHKHRFAKWFYKNNKDYLALSEGDRFFTEELFYLVSAFTMFAGIISFGVGLLWGMTLWN